MFWACFKLDTNLFWAWFGYVWELDSSKNVAPLVLACSMHLLTGRQTQSSLIVICWRIILACDYCQAWSSSNHTCKLAKTVSTYSFQAPSSKTHAPFKLVQAELFLMGIYVDTVTDRFSWIRPLQIGHSLYAQTFELEKMWKIYVWILLCFLASFNNSNHIEDRQTKFFKPNSSLWANLLFLGFGNPKMLDKVLSLEEWIIRISTFLSRIIVGSSSQKLFHSTQNTIFTNFRTLTIMTILYERIKLKLVNTQ